MHRNYALALALALSAAHASAHQVDLLPAKDNTLYQSATGALSNGLGDHLFAGRVGQFGNSEVRRAVLAFDVAGAIPAGSTIDSVELVLNCDGAPPTATPTSVALHRLLADWGEGSSQAFPPGGLGATSTPGDATWIHTFFPGSSWTNAGGDFVATASGSALVDQPAIYTWSTTAQLVLDVQDWLDNPAANFGWILIGDETVDQSARRYLSLQSAIASEAPLLRVHFTTTPPAVFCAAKVNSLGCTPAIGFSGRASASAGAGFVINANQVLNNKNGLLFYSLVGPGGGPFVGGTLCASAPLRRTPPMISGGNPPPNDCSGLFSRDFNVWIASGADPALIVGQQFWSQWYYRDPAASFSAGLSNGLSAVIGP